MKIILQQLSVEALSDKDELINKGYNGNTFASETIELEHILKRLAKQLQAGKQAFWILPYFIIDADHHKIVGTIGFKDEPDNGSIEIGGGIITEHWGHGVFTSAVRQLIAIAFAQPSIKKILSLPAPDNIASKTICQKLGFKYEKTFVNDRQKTLELWSKSAQ